MFTRTTGTAAGIQNRRVISLRYRICYRTHRSVGYCIQSCQGIFCGVPNLLQNSQKCRVLWCNCHRTHRSIGYCGTAVTELTEVLCRVKTEGNYPRYRSVGPYRTYPWKPVSGSNSVAAILSVWGMTNGNFRNNSP